MQASVCLCESMCACRRTFKQTDGSGALHTHVWALLMPVCCVARCVCVLLRVCSSLRVCAVAVCYSLQRPGLVLRPLMVSERGVPADERLVDPRGNTPDNTPEKRRHFVFYAVFLIRGYCWTESDSQSDSLLPNQRHFNLPEGTLYYLWVCINTTFTCN